MKKILNILLALSVGFLISSYTIVPLIAQVQVISLAQASTCLLGFDQPAGNLTEANTYTYKAIVNGANPGITVPVICTGVASPFNCSTALPIKTVGTHTVQLSATSLDGTSSLSASFSFRISGNPPLTPVNLRLIIFGGLF